MHSRCQTGEPYAISALSMGDKGYGVSVSGDWKPGNDHYYRRKRTFISVLFSCISHLSIILWS